jgi:hypothetical protein
MAKVPCGHVWGKCPGKAKDDNPMFVYAHTCGEWIQPGEVHVHFCSFCPASK